MEGKQIETQYISQLGKGLNLVDKYKSKAYRIFWIPTELITVYFFYLKLLFGIYFVYHKKIGFYFLLCFLLFCVKVFLNEFNLVKVSNIFENNNNINLVI